MITVKPDTLEGGLILLNDDGDPIGIGFARASQLLPGYVSLVLSVDHPDGMRTSFALRVPASWLTELDNLRKSEPEPAPAGWVYVMYHPDLVPGGAFRFGSSDRPSPATRVRRALRRRPGSTHVGACPGGSELEASLHKYFYPFRANPPPLPGRKPDINSWYRDVPEVRRWVEDHIGMV